MTDDAPERVTPSLLRETGERFKEASGRHGPNMNNWLILASNALTARDATIAEQAREIEALNKEIVRLRRPRCELHGELADDGLCDVCEGRGLWEGV